MPVPFDLLLTHACLILVVTQIEPNVARVNIPDERFNWLKSVYKPKSEVPAFLEVVDIAGLVKGASQGAGLGNAFLSNIRAVDGILHVCRCFEDADVVHVEDRVDPVEDLNIITGELRQKDEVQVQGHVDTLEALKKRGGGQFKKDHQEELDSAIKVRARAHTHTHTHTHTLNIIDQEKRQMLTQARLDLRVDRVYQYT